MADLQMAYRKANAGHQDFPAIPQSLPVTGPSWLAYPTPYPKFSSLGSGGGAALPYRVSPFWEPTLLYLWDLLAAAPGIPFSLLLYPPPSLPRGSAQLGHVKSGLSWMSLFLPLGMFSHISTRNLLLHYAWELSCPFLSFYYFFHSAS